jgi:cytochrome c oxidase cbb3-type subunit 3
MVKVTHALAAAGLMGALSLSAQGQPPAGAPPPPPQAPVPATQPQRGRGDTFPSQQRPPGDPDVIARGKALYGVNCTFCHGPDLRGGQLNGPNLLRSQLVLSDQAGELIIPIVHGSRADKGMPPLPIPDEDVKVIAEYIHSVWALSPRQGMPPPGGAPAELNVLVGDAAAGRGYFEAKCASCHSATGDLAGVAARVADAKALQNLWVSGGRGGGRGGAAPNAPTSRAVTAAVTLPSGEKVEGRLVRIDDFIVSLSLADGSIRSFTRTGAKPRVEVTDPLERHRGLLSIYTDKDMHDITAFLATLK